MIIVKTCKIHGPLPVNACNWHKSRKSKNGSWSCKSCDTKTYIKRAFNNSGLRVVPDALVELKAAAIALKRLRIGKHKEKLDSWLREQYLQQLSRL